MTDTPVLYCLGSINWDQYFKPDENPEKCEPLAEFLGGSACNTAYFI